MQRLRRIVTGEPTPGDSHFTHVEEVAPLVPWPGFAQYHVWGWDETPTLPFDSAEPYVPRTHFPEPGGVRITANYMANVNGVPPEEMSEQNRADAETFQALMAPAGGAAAGSKPGMHRTDTIDIGIVISGEVTVESEDGTTATLGPGDVYVQNGAMHLWHPNPDNPALMVFVLVGAERSEAGEGAA
jgi:hypothetical protein